MKPIEPWFRVAETVLIPPIAVWFNWRFEGLDHIPPEGPVLVAANHISYFDPLAHGRLVEKAGRRPRFLAKIELYKNPLVRAVLQGAGQIKVRRGSGDHAPVDEALRALEEGKVVVVYPESTVTRNEDFSPMEGKTGIARLALESRVPVLPIAVWGSHPVWQRGGARNLQFGRPIWLKAGTPIDFSAEEEHLGDRATLRRVTDRVMDEMAVLVEDLRSRYPKGWS